MTDLDSEKSQTAAKSLQKTQTSDHHALSHGHPPSKHVHQQHSASMALLDHLTSGGAHTRPCIDHSMTDLDSEKSQTAAKSLQKKLKHPSTTRYHIGITIR
jgi:hypothetical protein